MSDNSDYGKPRTNLFELLPEVYQSDTNRSVFENLFNRFLTKAETKRVSGYIGEGNPNAVVKRQIQEFNVHRQAYQLQPILYNKIGSVEWMSSWKDLLNEIERLGIDPEKVQDWMSLLKFNWAPPIDIDKLIHYRDYYWYDEDNPSSRPQYITIRSRCATATANANFQQSLVDEYGAEFPITRIDYVDDLPAPVTVTSILTASDIIIVEGDLTNDLEATQYVKVNGTLTNNGVYRLAVDPSYDTVSDRTSLTLVAGSLTGTDETIGELSLERFDKLIIGGDYERLFDPGFVFFFRNSSNVDLNDSFLTVASSTYDDTNAETILTLTTVFTNNDVSGIISLAERLAAVLAARDCQCSGSIGWDLLQWDDNPNEPTVWSQDNPYVDPCGSVITDFDTLIAAISNAGPPPGTPCGEGQLWWDTDADALYQYSETDGWKATWNNFSIIVEETTGQNYWDKTPGCGVQTVVTGSEQWIEQNKWLHKTDVPNFAYAKQAAVPILEYDWDLELNEWTYTQYKWKYRAENFQAFEETDAQPDYIEAVPVTIYERFGTTQNTIVLSEQYGDLTEYFAPGRKFAISYVNDVFTVESSVYSSIVPNTPMKTMIVLTTDIVAPDLAFGSTAVGTETTDISTGQPAPLRPLTTSQGDLWKGHFIHWLFKEQEETLPIVHQPRNVLAEIEETQPVISTPDYDYQYTYYAQRYLVKVPSLTDFWLTSSPLPGSTRSLRERALIGSNDVRVYINGVRRYGTYLEYDDNADGFVDYISFLSGYEPQQFDEVVIEVGEATPSDFGWGSVPVRTIENDIEFAGSTEPTNRSLIRYRKEEQVKSQTNQYPLFDMYNVDGSPAYKASPLFAYATSPDADVNGSVGLRLVTDANDIDFVFEQYLVEDDGTMYAYRDYALQTDDIWVNLNTNEVKFWDGLAWSDRTFVGSYYLKAVVSNTTPTAPWKNIDGVYWLDTLTNELKVRTVVGDLWTPVSAIYGEDDPTLQTVWKKGLNDEVYVAQQRDWEKRTLEEYEAEQALYVEQTAEELLAADPTLTEPDAIQQATDQWYSTQVNHLSPSGYWVGDWEIPDPLYYNYGHENRKQVALRELITHFDTIIESQPKVPGYNGPRENMFHLIATGDVNYGLGGTIREYNHGFDTFLSSLFVNQVSPRSLIEFAQDQYEVQLNSMKELYRSSGVELFTTVTGESLTNLSKFVVDSVIESYEQNDNAAALYGDTTAFQDILGTSEELGVRNWIATLPIFRLLERVTPAKVVDEDHNLNQVIHHDGHRNNYELADAVVEGITRAIIAEPDPRTATPGSGDDPKPFGVIPSPPTAPPNNVTEFESWYETQIVDREGVYWYHIDGIERTLYRLELTEIGTVVPASSYPDGTLWLDLRSSQEVLRIKRTNPNTGSVDWEIPQGLTAGESPIRLHNGTDPSDLTTAEVSAWTAIDLNAILTDIIYEVENRLYSISPEDPDLKYDFDALRESDPATYNQYLEEQFLAYASESEIVAPLSNSVYAATDPFTWNYKYSTIGRGFPIVDVDVANNAFVVAGHVAGAFDPCQSISPPATCSTSGVQISFYIKNNGPNDGTWTIVATDVNPTAEEFCSSVSAPCPGTEQFTRIFVQEPVVGISGGTIYQGQLPSNVNDGSESGGDWRDLYQKMFGTPYPHLEPWSMQGYTDKPDWWDREYRNDDPKKWGDRRWKYKHGFDIEDARATPDSFVITGDFREVFPTNRLFVVDRSPGVQDGQWQVGKLTNGVGDPADIVSVTTGPATSASIELLGDFVPVLGTGARFAIVSNSGELKQLLTVTSSFFTGPPTNRTIVVVEEAIEDATGYDNISGATYDVVSNVTEIRINTTALLPTRNDVTVDGPGGRIAIAYGMWNNIVQGEIPPGVEYPNGVTGITGDFQDITAGIITEPLPSFNYLCVNIDNHEITTGGTYQPDDVLPPYWKYTDHFGVVIPTFDSRIRSVFSQLSTEIIAESADYVFGDAGYVEWVWRNSSQFLYDQLTIAFRMDPVRFLYSAFGPEYHTIAGLLVDQRLEQVLSHTITDFHGDLVDNELLQFNGINQWYVNYLRYAGIDLSMSDFRTMWTQWTAPMMYQFSSFIDTPSLDVAHRLVCVSEFDYRVAAKRSPGTEDFWLESFDIYTLGIPPRLARYDNEYQWKFEISTKPPYTKTVDYYDVQNYQFYADPDTDLCTLYSWSVTAASFFNDTFSVRGNQTPYFVANRTFDVVDSTSNDGTYTVVSAAYDLVNDETIIQVQEEVPGGQNDGRVILNYRSLPWQTGEKVVLSTHETLPTPLQTDNTNGVYEYFFVRESSNTFRLATTRTEADNGNYVDITSSGRNDHFVGKIHTTFTDGMSSTFWRHYVVDTSTVLSFAPPFDVSGIQNIINIIDGYEQFTKDEGWRFNVDNTLRDPGNTSFSVNWQHELRRFIQFNYNLRSQRNKVEDRFPVELDETSDTFSITDNSRPQYITGDPVTIYSSNKVYPTPLVHGGRYYMIRDELSKFRLAATRGDAIAGIAIDLTVNVASEKLFLTEPMSLTKNAPKFELNPFKNAVWFRPERGIVSNLLKGPTEDIFTSQLMVDQYGRAMTQDAIRIFREDRQTKIAIEDQLDNDIEPVRIYQNPYNYLHLGAVHLFVDTFEHVLIFNDETTEGQLLYDPFVGLNLTKFEMLFNRQLEFTQRPNVGGQYLSTFFNQGADLDRNIEASIEDLRLMYDTYQVIEANDIVQQSRKTLGYEGRETYLDNLNLNAKSQFAFWRGQIQHKGAMTSIQSFVNSRRFIDAKVDEFWAVKVGDFGSSLDKEYVEMWLGVRDARNNELRLQFLNEENLCDSGYASNVYDSICGYAWPNEGEGVLTYDDGWTGVSITDSTRWVNYPDQQAKLANNAGLLYFDLKLRPEMMVELTPELVESGRYVRHNFAADFVTITGSLGQPENRYIDCAVTSLTYPIAADGRSAEVENYIPLSDMIRVFRGSYNTSHPDYDSSRKETFFVGEELVNGVDFIENVTPYTGSGPAPYAFTSTSIQFAEDVSGDIIRVVYGNATLTETIHYSHYTSNIVELFHPEIANGTLVNAKLWGWLFDKESLNPHKILDLKSETVVSVIQYWDPARGHHYYNGINIVDIQTDTDPAYYSDSAEYLIGAEDGDTNYQYDRIANGSTRTAENVWGSSRVGTTWMNTGKMSYVPYYDPQMIPSLDQRLLQWGGLADWSELKIYTWVESNVHPEQWNALAEQEEGDTSIDQRKRKSGRVYKTLFHDPTGDGKWVEAADVYEEFDVVLDATAIGVETVIPVTVWSDVVAAEDDLTLYVNGRHVNPVPEDQSPLEVPSTGWKALTTTSIVVYGVTSTDRLRLVQHPPGYNPTYTDGVDDYRNHPTNIADKEAALSGSPLVWMEDYRYSYDTYYDQFGIEQPLYYFWVEDRVTKGTRSMSPVNAQTTMTSIPIPYVMYEDVQQARTITYEGQRVDLPMHFNKAVITGLREIINDDNRYAIRWTRDMTLRDNLDFGTSALQLKDYHEQWDLIRREMAYHVPRWLWNKLTESIVGYKLDNPSVRVPSYQRELYDEENLTDTRYGIGDGQAFTDGELALGNIIADLNDPNNDFKPVDINVFFQNNSFDSQAAIIESMDTIYNTFPYEHVNRMFFDCLLDAFSKKRKYEDIFKTSMIALHGIRPFQVGGLFDD